MADHKFAGPAEEAANVIETSASDGVQIVGPCGTLPRTPSTRKLS